MTEHFPLEIDTPIKEHLYAPADYNHLEQQDAFMKRCKSIELTILRGAKHFMQYDAQVVSPLTTYGIQGKSLPRGNLVNRYIMNAWLAMKFLEDNGLCSNPQY